MKLYSKDEAADITWLDTDEGRRMRSFFEPIFNEGVQAFVSNIETEVFILHIDNLFIPLTVNTKEYENSYVCSLYSFFLYAEEEMKRQHRYLLRIILNPFLTVLKIWFRFSKINQLVIVNNFLLSTNLYQALSSSQTLRICQFLKEQFPNHAILFRSLNTYSEKRLCDNLFKIGCEFITSRSIYFFDPKNYPEFPSKKRWIIQKDKKLRDHEAIKILQHSDFNISDAVEVKRLYDLLYLEKYSYFNPAFTVRFFEQAILTKTFNLSGIQYEGKLVGVIGFFKTKGIMATPIVGYDTKLPESLGLYRMLTALVLDESLSSHAVFHMSAGVGHFKRQRGAFQELESMAVFCHHLPFYRRVIWKILAIFLNKIGAPILKKYKL
jgi:hypothetical protein